MSKGVDISGILSLMIGFFVLFLIVNALHGTINTAVNNLNTTMVCNGEGAVNSSACESGTPPYTEGDSTAGTLVVYGWKLLQYVIGLGALVLAVVVIKKKASEL